MDIYGYQDSREVLREAFNEFGTRSGIKSKAAQHLGMHGSLLSQVLSEKAHLTPEQALKATEFFRWSGNEADYFMSLVLKERAGTPTLQSFYEKKLGQLRRERHDLKKTAAASVEPAPEVQALYYSSVLYSVAYVLASIPEYQTQAKLAQRIGLSPEEFDPIYKFLFENGFLETQGGKIKAVARHLHLSKDSNLIRTHHSNLRATTLALMQKPLTEKQLHYSSVFSLSKNDAEKVRDLILECFRKTTKLVEQSKEEDCYVFCFDYYPWR